MVKFLDRMNRIDRILRSYLELATFFLFILFILSKYNTFVYVRAARLPLFKSAQSA